MFQCKEKCYKDEIVAFHLEKCIVSHHKMFSTWV